MPLVEEMVDHHPPGIRGDSSDACPWDDLLSTHLPFTFGPGCRMRKSELIWVRVGVV